ncbi:MULTISPECIES: hypothetical protein [unclassified Streptomyces]|uniref:hypothetical protein n=1 Tax=unclassified Streptomyces TaxID=2593676 RepID=UPI0036F11D86
MAALDTAQLELLVRATITNRKVGMELLNVLRVANGKAPHPDNYNRGDLTNPHDSEWRAALDGVRSALEA